MHHYEIEQTATAVIMWKGDAKSEQDALDAMARDAGYKDYASIPEEVGGGETLEVRKVTP